MNTQTPTIQPPQAVERTPRQWAPVAGDPPSGGDHIEYALALIDLGQGRWADALTRFDEIHDPVLAVTSLPDRIEAAVHDRRTDDARVALETLESWSSDHGTPWEHSRVAVARAMMAVGEEATAHFEEALRLTADARPFHRARVQLLYGEHLRRERHRADARKHLRAAVETFELLGADPWAERARTELNATGQPAAEREPESAFGLTPQERQVARLVAEGLTNKEVAVKLYLSPRTIDAHLRSVFPKLGINSRRELRRLSLGLREQPALAA